MSDRLPPPAAARIAEAAAFSSGNSPIAIQSWWPKVRYQPMSLPPTLLKSLATASSSRFSGLANMLLTASAVYRPREVDWHGISPGYFDCSISCRIDRPNAGDHRTEFQP